MDIIEIDETDLCERDETEARENDWASVMNREVL